MAKNWQLFLVVVAVFATLAQLGAACASYVTCRTCTPLPGCGWCLATASCQTGTSGGPTGGGRCSSGWDGAGTCPTTPAPTPAPTAACSAQTGCASCTQLSGCGWCGSTSLCVKGLSGGPTTGTCISNWAYISSACPATTPAPTPAPTVLCSAQTNCTACASRGSCGWCGASSTCVPGAVAGPLTGVCASGWGWVTSSCPTAAPSPSTCTAMANCSTCTGLSHCGWCQYSASCVAGSSTGPATGRCASGWAFTRDKCLTCTTLSGTCGCAQCNGNALAVQGTLPSCTCTCLPAFGGTACQACLVGAGTYPRCNMAAADDYARKTATTSPGNAVVVIVVIVVLGGACFLAAAGFFLRRRSVARKGLPAAGPALVYQPARQDAYGGYTPMTNIAPAQGVPTGVYGVPAPAGGWAPPPPAAMGMYGPPAACSAQPQPQPSDAGLML